jgi:hypothetical protein
VHATAVAEGDAGRYPTDPGIGARRQQLDHRQLGQPPGEVDDGPGREERRYPELDGRRVGRQRVVGPGQHLDLDARRHVAEQGDAGLVRDPDHHGNRRYAPR